MDSAAATAAAAAAPDRPAPLHSTLVAARQQKSWMSSSAPHPLPNVPKRPRGRPPKAPQPVPPSGPASPLLANLASSPPTKPSSYAHIAVLPSPSPSEETPSVSSPYAAPGQLPQTAPPNAHTPSATHVSSTPALASAAAWYTAQDCWEAIHGFERAYAASPDHPRDTRRMAVVKDAVRHQDWAYLTLHQYYCLLSYDQAAAPVALRTQPKLPQAVKLLQDVLGNNNQLSPLYLSFFAAFPAPIGVLSTRWPSMFQQQGFQFLLFVTHAPDHDMLRLTCHQHLHPPLSLELGLHYKITSPLFQRLLFTSCLRWICQTLPQSPLHQSYEAQALAIFDQSRTAFAQRKRAFGPLQSHDLLQELNYYGRQLKKLLENHKAIIQNNHLAATPWPSQVPMLRSQPHDPYQLSTLRLPSNNGPGEDCLAVPRDMQQPRARGQPPNRLVSHANSAPSLHHRPPHQGSAVAQPPFTPLQAQEPSWPGAPLLPPRGWVQPQQRVPHPARFSLHQAHLRSPTLRAHVPISPLYCFQQGYLLSPSRLPEAVTGIETLSFTLTATQLETIPRHNTAESGHCTRSITEQSKIIRLRCIQWLTGSMPNEKDWAAADTAWIPYSYFTFNNTSLQQRRKVHYGKDQPIDLTPLVRQGSNTVQVTIMSPTTENLHLNYLVAVEVLGFKSHDAITHTCLSSRRIPASAVLNTIKQKLSTDYHNDEEDLAIVASNLTIKLFDPISASSMCAIPVRSRHCPHHDCFDLHTFLTTRPRKGDASAPDAWRCPICNADARPSQLVVDGFLEKVMSELQQKGLGDTRAIVVRADGVWTPKTETREGVGDDTPPPESLWADKEIIDLSD